MTGDELYKRMLFKERNNTPTETELIEALQNWITWANKYSPLITESDQFVNVCNSTVELLARYEFN